MKKVFLIIVLAFAGFLANASNGKKVTPIKPIELQKNMVLSTDKTTPKKVQQAWDCYYMGVYDVYVDGDYWGVYDVWICFFNEAV